MRRLGSKTIAFAAGLAMFGAASVQAATDLPANAPARVEMTDDGPILVTPSRMTLYTFSMEETSGKIQCTNVAQEVKSDGIAYASAPVLRAEMQKSCTQKWPPYLAGSDAKPAGDFALINRPEGGKQWTWRGKPLYLSIKDHKPGERHGATFAWSASAAGGGVGRNRGGWRLAQMPFPDFPPTLQLVRIETSLVLATGQRPVYTPKKGATEAAGAEQFSPILTGALGKVSGDWSIIDTGDGRLQYSYKGKPLYAAPEDLTNYDIADIGGWEMVVFHQGSGRPPEIETRPSLKGDVFTDKAGRSLYVFNCGVGRGGASCDDPGDAAIFWVGICGSPEECAQRWKPYLPSSDAKPEGEWSIVDVASPMFTDPLGFTYPPEVPRVKTWAYRGKPVYTYYEDQRPGDVWGDNIRWGFGGSSFVAVLVPGRNG